MLCERFRALLGLLHVVDPSKENEADKLHKVNRFLDRNEKPLVYQPLPLMKEW